MYIRTNDSITADKIEDIQKKYNFSFPQSYYNFLMDTNGGYVVGRTVCKFEIPGTGDETRIKEFFGVKGDLSGDIEYYNDMYADDLDGKAFIIGKDYNNGYIVLMEHNDQTLICYWDEKLKFSVSSEEGNAYVIATSFDDLIEYLGGINIIRKGEKDMTKVDYYPLGSVVLLEGAVRKMLIISRGLVIQKDDSEVFFDYAGVPYPEGLTGDQVAYFNHDSITKVIFQGYSDEDDKLAVENINHFLDKRPELERADVENWNA